MNLKPFIRQGPQDFTPYNIQISTKDDMMDQKNNLIKIKPGFLISIKIWPGLKIIKENFEALPLSHRKCKMPYEKSKFKFMKKYSKVNCEFECAAKKAIKHCQCLPWFYPNNFTEIPICDMFGAKCFDMIMSNKNNYKLCKDDCIEECSQISYTLMPTYVPLDTAELCETPLFKQFFKERGSQYEFFNYYDSVINGQTRIKPTDSGDRNDHELCKDYVKKYVAVINVESNVKTITKTMKKKRIMFNDQIAVIGGTLGLFSGMSILSMVEIICLIFKLLGRAMRCQQPEKS